MATYIELQKQIEVLQKEADALKATERKGVIARMKEAIQAYDISAKELGLVADSAKKAAPAKKRVVTKKRGARASRTGITYSDAQGNTWGGLGKRPNWLREALANGRQLEEFLVSRR